MSDPVKKENKSQLLKRSITNVKNNATNLVERVGVPVVIGYLNPNTNKVVFMMDSESKDLLGASSILEKLETVLNASHKSGKKLQFVTDQNNVPEPGLGTQSNKLKSHLPTPAHRLISERKKYDFDSVRTLLGSALNSEGFGRGTGKLRYKEASNQPAWFNEALEQHIGVTWETFAGLNTKFKKEKKEVMYEIILAIYKHYLGDRVDEFYLDRSEGIDVEKKKSKENVHLDEEAADHHQSEGDAQHQLLGQESQMQAEQVHSHRQPHPHGLGADSQVDQFYQYQPPEHVIPKIYETSTPEVFADLGYDAQSDAEKSWMTSSDVFDPEVESFHEQPRTVFTEPLSNFTRLMLTPRAPPTPVSLRPSTSRLMMSPQIEENVSRMNNTCKISVQSKGNIARNILESMPVDSPINHPKKRKNTMDEDDCPLTPGWLEDIFINPRETEPGRVQLMNWRFRNINGEDRLCLTISDGKAVTKHVVANEDLEEEVRQADLYSVFEISVATILDGCMLLLQSIDFLDKSYVQPIALGHDITIINKEFFADVFAKKQMVIEGEKVPDHPGFKATPVVTRSRARRGIPAPKRLKTGGFSCDHCGKKYKSMNTFNVHKCNK